MTARDDILSRVREATAGVLAPERPVLRGSGPVAVGLFLERVADYRAVVERCTPQQLAERVKAAVHGSVVIPEGLGVELPDAVLDDDLSSAELDRMDTVVTEATVGIAETGTIVLDHGAGQGRRALTLVPDRHVCIVGADQVVADVPDFRPSVMSYFLPCPADSSPGGRPEVPDRLGTPCSCHGPLHDRTSKDLATGGSRRRRPEAVAAMRTRMLLVPLAVASVVALVEVGTQLAPDTPPDAQTLPGREHDELRR